MIDYASPCIFLFAICYYLHFVADTNWRQMTKSFLSQATYLCRYILQYWNLRHQYTIELPLPREFIEYTNQIFQYIFVFVRIKNNLANAPYCLIINPLVLIWITTCQINTYLIRLCSLCNWDDNFRYHTAWHSFCSYYPKFNHQMLSEIKTIFCTSEGFYHLFTQVFRQKLLGRVCNLPSPDWCLEIKLTLRFVIILLYYSSISISNVKTRLVF